MSFVSSRASIFSSVNIEGLEETKLLFLTGPGTLMFCYSYQPKKRKKKLLDKTEFLSPEQIRAHCCCGRHIFDLTIPFNTTDISFLETNVPWAFSIPLFSTRQAEGVFAWTLHRKKRHNRKISQASNGSNLKVCGRNLLCVTIQMKVIEQYFHVVLFIMLYKVMLTLKSVEKMFIMLYKVVLTFKSVDETPSV